MTKGEKIFAVCSVAFILTAGGATAVVIANSKQPTDEIVESEITINADNLLTELKVGKYYLENGTDEEYIEVYPDQTMCMFGYYLPEDELKDLPDQILAKRRKNYELFTTRQPYKLSDTVKGISLGGTSTGYGYTDENCITFSSAHKGLMKYIYRNE